MTESFVGMPLRLAKAEFGNDLKVVITGEEFPSAELVVTNVITKNGETTFVCSWFVLDMGEK